MSKLLTGRRLTVGLVCLVAPGMALSDYDSLDQCPKVFADEAFGSDSYRADCQRELDKRRAQLDAWGIDSDDMTSLQAWDRFAAEQNVRLEAQAEREQSARLESERLAVQRAEADAETQRMAAVRDQEAQAYAERQMATGRQMMQEQSDMLQGMGVGLAGMSIDASDTLSDDEFSETELRMYEKMVEDGAAPGCKGLKGAALVDCVDAAIYEEEE